MVILEWQSERSMTKGEVHIKNAQCGKPCIKLDLLNYIPRFLVLKCPLKTVLDRW